MSQDMLSSRPRPPPPTPYVPGNKRNSIQRRAAEVSLPEFVPLYFNSFPLRFVVTRCGDNIASVCHDDHLTAISTDTVDVLFLKDSAGVEFSLLLHSDMQLGLIYDPNNLMSAAYLGYEFETVEDVMNVKVKPKLLRATRSYSAGREIKSVEKDELFVIRKVKSGYLKVYSITRKMDKKLPKSCRVGFTTAPHKVAMPVGDLLEHVPNVGGAKAVLVVGNSVITHHIPHRWLAEPVTIFQPGQENVLVAKRTMGDQHDIHIPVLSNIYVQVEHKDIRTSEQQPAASVHDATPLNRVTRVPSKCDTPIVDSTPTHLIDDDEYVPVYPDYSTVYPEYSAVNKNRTPSTPLSTSPQSSRSNSFNQSSDEGTPYKYNRSRKGSHDNMPPKQGGATSVLGGATPVLGGATPVLGGATPVLGGATPVLGGATPVLGGAIPVLGGATPVLGGATPVLGGATPVFGGGATPEAIYVNLQTLQQPPLPLPLPLSPPPSSAPWTCKDATEQLHQPSTEQPYDDIVSVREAILRGGSEDTYENVGGQSTSPHPPADGGSGFSSRRHSSNSSKSSTGELSSQKENQTQTLASADKNRDELKKLTKEQVLDLLDAMNLSQYKVKFEKECVTGSVLSNCDDDVLCSELGVTQRLHRIRLHTLISGEDSAIRFLSGKALSRTCH